MKITKRQLRRTIREAIKGPQRNLDGDPRRVLDAHGNPIQVTHYSKEDRIGPRDWSHEFKTPRPQRMADSYIEHYETKGLDQDLEIRLKTHYERMFDKDKKPMHEIILASGYDELINYIESLRIDWN